MNEKIKERQTTFKDLSGKKIGDWTVLYRAPNGKGSKTRFFCKCKCGKESLVFSLNLTRGLSKSCLSCSKKKMEKYHGMSDTKTYATYVQMIERCHNEKHKYFPYYGERGIYVCDRWKDSFKNFLEDMGESPKGLSIDRVDNEKGYSKENCRWATKKEQQRNRRNSIHIGEISNGWEVLRRGRKRKTWTIKCTECGEVVTVRSCNFRRRHKHTCEV